MMPNKLSVAIKTALITVVQGPKGQEGGGGGWRWKFSHHGHANTNALQAFLLYKVSVPSTPQYRGKSSFWVSNQGFFEFSGA